MDLSNITINKHSSIRIAGSRILYFDPYELQEETHDADYIFITHDHYDHFDPPSVLKLIKADTLVVAPETMRDKLLKEIQLDEANCVFCQPGDVNELDQLWVQAVPAYNILKPFHTKDSKWVGYIVQMDGLTYYIAGDTDVNDDVRKVKCDLALIPIGGHFTMDKEQAAELICEMKPKAVIPTHYGAIVGRIEDGTDFKDHICAADKEIHVELKI